METRFSSEYPEKLGEARNGFELRYNVKETPMDEIVREWESQRGGMEGEGSSPDDAFVKEHKWMYNVVRVPMGQWNYGGIVNAIVRDKYASDEMESITNNMNVIVAEFFEHLVADGILSATKYLMGSINTENTENFAAMQKWRSMAKAEARQVLKMV